MTRWTTFAAPLVLIVGCWRSPDRAPERPIAAVPGDAARTDTASTQVAAFLEGDAVHPEPERGGLRFEIDLEFDPPYREWRGVFVDAEGPIDGTEFNVQAYATGFIARTDLPSKRVRIWRVAPPPVEPFP